MVVAAYPLAKIGLLLMKQLSKPVANIIKNEAKRHPKIRKYVIAPTGKAYHWIESQTVVHVKGGKPSEVEKITEEEIVELGSNALGEIILFGLLTMILLAEYNRQGDKKAVLEKTKAEEINNLQDTLLELFNEVDQMKKSIESIKHEIRTAPDVFDFEEQRHLQVHDHNFLDLISSRNKTFKGQKKTDLNSPSI